MLSAVMNLCTLLYAFPMTACMLAFCCELEMPKKPTNKLANKQTDPVEVMIFM